jgi:hypothetical protein
MMVHLCWAYTSFAICCSSNILLVAALQCGALLVHAGQHGRSTRRSSNNNNNSSNKILLDTETSNKRHSSTSKHYLPLPSWKTVGRGGALSLSSFSQQNDGNGSNDDNHRRKLIAGALLGTIIGVPLIAEGYARMGTLHPFTGLDDPAAGAGAWRNVEHATIVFHGAGGQDQYTAELMTRLESLGYNSDNSNDNNNDNNKQQQQPYYATLIDWSRDSQNTLQASFNGQRIGRIFAETLLSKAPNLQTLHLIGISVGSFVADSCATRVKELVKVKVEQEQDDDKSSIYIQMTTLDPFCQRAVLGIGYGNKNFGKAKNVDYGQQYLNTDDPVPSTNNPLLECACKDVTKLRPEAIFGHDWPLVYYARSPECGTIIPDAEKSPRGSVVYPEK